MEQKNMSLVGLIGAFEKAFDHCNSSFFNSGLKRPVITIQQGAKARAYGWVSVAEVWHEIDGEQTAHELNISAEYLERDFVETVTTLMHEMVHLQNMADGVQDVARAGTRHNAKFASTASNHGMEGYKGEDYDKIGWRVKLTEQTAETLIPALDFLQAEITISRTVDGEKKKAKKSSVIKYVCPICGASCRATKEIFIMCMDCNENMVQEI